MFSRVRIRRVAALLLIAAGCIFTAIGWFGRTNDSGGPVLYQAVADGGTLQTFTITVHDVTLIPCDLDEAVDAADTKADVTEIEADVVGVEVDVGGVDPDVDGANPGVDGVEPDSSAGSIVDDLVSWITGSQPVLAGHGAGTDEGQVVGQWAVSATDETAAPTDLGTGWLHHDSYCEAQIGLADRTTGSTTNGAPTILATASGQTTSTETSWGIQLPLVNADGDTVEAVPDTDLVVQIQLVVSDDYVIEPGEDGARDLLRSVAASSSAVVIS